MSANSHSPTRDALVLSAAGMFGAWQAGAWKALAGRFRPEIVVGVSAGALNGWAIAGGCPPDELIGHWTERSRAATLRLKLQWPWKGAFDAALLKANVHHLYERYAPRLRYGVVAVELPQLKPRLFETPAVDWRHLLASCAIPAVLPPVRIDGRLYCDGGLISALPLWAAAAMGARRIVALNALPLLPSRLVRTFVTGVRRVAGAPGAPAGVETVILTPSASLGRMRHLLFWEEQRIQRIVELGEKDAKTISFPDCFGGQ